ncbi:hypothetical protein ACIBJF_28595 [Streptomyces sp. NPDC050743]|uniref:hypothetical protein n=1 Tax=Streptomyces sp. NPDC050743 TaxID=3365634 RepID=UPI0037BAAAA3
MTSARNAVYRTSHPHRDTPPAQQLFIEFEAPFSGFMPEARDYKVQLQARVGHRKGWRRLLTFTLRAANIIDPDRYTVYNNAPIELTKEDQKEWMPRSSNCWKSKGTASLQAAGDSGILRMTMATPSRAVTDFVQH